MMWAEILSVIRKFLDFITPWSTYWVEKRKKKNQKKEDAQKRMDDAAKKGDGDAYWDAYSDWHSS